MANEVATTNSNAVADYAAKLSALQAYAQDQQSGIIRYARFHGQLGQYITKDADKAEVVIKLKTEFILNTPEIAHGHICWKDGSPADRVITLMTENPVLPDISTLPDHGPYEGDRDGWQETLVLPLYNVKEKMGYVLQLSGGAMTSTKRFLGQLISKAAEDGKNAVTDLPIIALDKGSYKSRVPGMVGKEMPIPKYNIVGWVKASDYNLTISGKPVTEDEPAPETGHKAIAGGATTV